MIETLKLKFGRASGLVPITVNTTAVTVFVGPNNSGKSKALREIHQFCSSGNKNINDVIVDDIVFREFPLEVAEEKVSKVTLKPHVNEAMQPGHVFVGKRGTRHQINKAQLLDAFQKPNVTPSHICQWYLSYNTLILDGQSRIGLVKDQNAGDLQRAPNTSFQVLFRDDHKRAEIRRIVIDAFNRHFVIDPTNLGDLRIRLSDTAPANAIEERGIHQEAVDFHARAQHISEASDGVKAFVGMLTEIIAGDPSILLVDEPEAFLHPSLSFKLGKEVARASLETDKRVFVSTHSPTFVMGCIQSGAPVNIVRLTYRDSVATARILPNSDILRLMRNPLLRSTGVLSGLFYESVIVTESDTDRAFYQEVNERLLRFKPELGIPNCLFINAQNKQTVQTIIRPLRELGIPSVGIVDVDILKEGGSVWTNFLKGGFIPEISQQPLSNIRASLKKKLDATGLDMKRNGGIENLNSDDKQAAIDLFDQLDAYGLFTVRKGELESWLKSLSCSGHGPGWLIDIFEKMGEDPELSTYLKPSSDDVWEFIGNVKKWLFDPSRKGIPI
ncbi:AAA family ATPase [uncultured Rubinisphaera sp.]|uniref:ATP-dependent nuclease n=1 Tax=uncultured Rubinisphaera sp. TaxID=1678686 RepID=UPI0030DC2FDC|tara:strand:+ start:1589 stop:3259 length:1671 start_codon:yes stop_codon:yes gene_type:complete